MYVIEVYDQDRKKYFIKELDPKGQPATFTKKKWEAAQWRERNQAIMYAVQIITNTYKTTTSGRPNLLLEYMGFKVIKV